MLNVLEPAFQKLPERYLGWVDILATAQFRNYPSTLGLGLPLRAGEAVLFPAPPTGRGIADVQHDGPATRRAFANMTLHRSYSLFEPVRSSGSAAVQRAYLLSASRDLALPLPANERS